MNLLRWITGRRKTVYEVKVFLSNGKTIIWHSHDENLRETCKHIPLVGSNFGGSRVENWFISGGR